LDKSWSACGYKRIGGDGVRTLMNKSKIAKHEVRSRISKILNISCYPVLVVGLFIGSVIMLAMGHIERAIWLSTYGLVLLTFRLIKSCISVAVSSPINNKKADGIKIIEFGKRWLYKSKDVKIR
jgi:hypothetical protein